MVTLLLIEDDAAISSYIVEVIEMFFPTAVLVAHSAAEARLHWQNHKEKISVILSDLVLPNAAGEALVAELLQTNPQPQVVFMSGHLCDANELSRTLGKPVGVLLKPFRPADLKLCLEKAFAGEFAKA